jgi:hypothetical protein
MREVAVTGQDCTRVGGEVLDLPWKELPARLAEAAASRLLAAHEADQLETLWSWTHPLLEALKATPSGVAPEPGP